MGCGTGYALQGEEAKALYGLDQKLPATWKGVDGLFPVLLLISI